MMSALLFYLPWIISAAALGAFVGCATGPATPVPQAGRMALVLILVLAVVVALLAIIPGRYGHAYEASLGMSIAYLAGCWCGDRAAAVRAAPLFEKMRAHRPPAIERPEDGGDDLTLVGASLMEAQTLREAGVWRLSQMAAWTPDQAGWIGARVGVPATRVQNEWVEGARARLSRSSATALSVLSRELREASPSELLRIAGVGPRMASALAEMGVRRIDQVAAWSASDMEWMGERIGEPGRIEREMWAPQARLLYAGVDTTASVTRLTGRSRTGDPDAPLDDAALEELRAELEELSAAAGIAAFAGENR